MTPAQRQALDRLWPRYGIDLPDGALDLDHAFGRRAPRTLEIGFGMGDALLDLAQAHPERDFLGVEVYPPGIGRFLLRVEQTGLRNVRVVCVDAVEVLILRDPDAARDPSQGEERGAAKQSGQTSHLETPRARILRIISRALRCLTTRCRGTDALCSAPAPWRPPAR